MVQKSLASYERGIKMKALSKFFIFLTFCLCAPISADEAPSSNRCLRAFTNLQSQVEVQQFFSHKDHLNSFKNQEGYLRFCETHDYNGMEYVFDSLSHVLGKKFKILNWQQFRGTPQEFRALKPQVLDHQGNFKKEYQGMEGYAKFADEFYNGNMIKTYKNVSAVSDKRVFKQSGWQHFHGSTQEFRALKAQILDHQGNFKAEYQGTEGYAKFADEFYKGDMFKTFMNVSAVLDKRIFKQSGWQVFTESTKKFRAVSAQILDHQGNFKKEYQGMEGYARFADQFYKGGMSITFINVSAVLDKLIFKQSGWKNFKGTTEEFRALKAQILDHQGNFKAEYRDMEGYAKVADKFYNRDMSITFINVSAVLDKRIFKQSGWQQFKGSTQEFRALKAQILDRHGNFKTEYQGMEGYARFADEFYKGDMLITFINVSAVLDNRIFKQSGWQAFKGSTQEFRAIRSQILDHQGNFKEEYFSMEGYARFADQFYDGDMSKTYKNVSAFLDKWVLKQSGWQAFQGSTQEFRALKAQILDHQGNFKKEYRGMEGYARFADQFYTGDMRTTFINVSAVLDKRIFKQSGWQQFKGSTQEFRLVKTQVLDHQGNFKEEYRGMEGYARFADTFYTGDMKITFTNISAVFGGFKNIKLLRWKKFFGTSSQYRKLIQLFKDFSLEALRGLNGQQKVAHLIFNDHVINAYDNVSTLRDILFINPKEDWPALKWSKKALPLMKKI